MSETVKVTGERLMEIRTGLQMLKDRKVDLSVDLRVALWWKAIQPTTEAYRDVLTKIEQDELRAQVIQDAKERVDAMLAASERRIALSRDLFEVPVPKKPLVPSDLPKEVKGEGNEGNDRGRAAMMIYLAPEYLTLPDEE